MHPGLALRFLIVALPLAVAWEAFTARANEQEPSSAGAASPGSGDLSARPATHAFDADQLPVYAPPEPPRGASPAGRAGAGTRGLPLSAPAVVALAPRHLGHTIREQPTLYWFMEKDSAAGVSFYLSRYGSVDLVLETLVAGPLARGIHQVRLEDHEVRLELGERYEWSLVPASGQNPGLSHQGGSIERVAPADALREQLDADPDRSVVALARGGIWYDAFSAASERIAREPRAALAREQRAALLDQVQLSSVAEADRLAR